MAKKSTALARLVPSVEVKQEDGTIVTVPVSSDDNSTANKVLASRMRGLIHTTIKKYEDDGQTLTPKELKELTSAARDIAEFSGEVYKTGEAIQEGGKPVDAIDVPQSSGVDFSKLKAGQKPSEEKEELPKTESGIKPEGESSG